MRQYEQVWLKLKRDRIAKVTAHRSLHARIYKAVVKEKWMDTGYKIEIEPYIATLWHTRKGSVITFTLTLKRNLDGVKAEDL